MSSLREEAQIAATTISRNLEGSNTKVSLSGILLIILINNAKGLIHQSLKILVS